MATFTNSPESPTTTMPATGVSPAHRNRGGASEGSTTPYGVPTGAPLREESGLDVIETVAAQTTFVPLVDLDVEGSGFRPESVYVEFCLLPLIGPSSCLLYRHVGPLVCRGDQVEVDLAELARNLGLGAKAGRNSAVVKALARLELFHLGRWLDGDRYALRRAVAPLGDRQARRLPEPARSIHYRSLRGSPTTLDPLQGCADRSGRQL